jgi:flavin-dependent dehydrogenase
VAAGALASQGAEVVVLERERHPRFHIGESLQPAAFDYLERHFGIGHRFVDQGFARKYGAVYRWGETREPWSVLFDPRLEPDLPGLTEETLLSGGYEHSWNVDRAVFDRILAETAAERGASVHENVTVHEPIMEGDRVVGVLASDANGQTVRYDADFVIDASGQNAFLGRKFKLLRQAPDLRCTATYAYFEGAGGVPGPLGRHVQYVVTVPEGWVWFIPTSKDVTGVGVVLRERNRLSEARFAEILASAELPLEGAKMLPGPRGEPLGFHMDWSFACERFGGPGWMMVGDAACFVDPILSGGVDFAIRGGFKAADVLTRRFGVPGSEEPALLADYETRVRTEFQAYLRLARYWYGNNRSVQGLFWEAAREIPTRDMYTPLRAFAYLVSGRYARDKDFAIFDGVQERNMFRNLGVDREAVSSVLGGSASRYARSA